MLATSGSEIKIWNLDPFYLINEYKPISNKPNVNGNHLHHHHNAITNFSVRPDGSTLASVMKDGTMNYINLQDQSQMILKENSDDAFCCAFSANGRLAVGNVSGNLDIIDFNSHAAKKRTWKIANAPLTCVTWNKNDRYIAAGCSNGSVTLYNSVINNMTKPLIPISNSINGRPASITSIQFSAVSSNLLGCSYDDGTVLIWDIHKETQHCLFKEHRVPCTSFAFSPINNILMISAGLDGLCCYDLTTKKLVKAIPFSDGVASLDMQSNGSSVCIGTTSGVLNIYDLRTGINEPKLSKNVHDTSVFCLKSFVAGDENILNNILRSSTASTTSSTFYSTGHPSLLTPENANRINPMVKKSNSTNFDLSNGMPPPNSIFSPDVPSIQPPQASSSQFAFNNSNNHQSSNLIMHSTANNGNGELNGDSFVLHKKTNGATHLAVNGKSIDNATTPDSKVTSNRGSNKLRNDLFSPLSNNTTIQNNIPIEETSLIAHFTQMKKNQTAMEKHVSPSASFNNLKASISPKSSSSSSLNKPKLELEVHQSPQTSVSNMVNGNHNLLMNGIVASGNTLSSVNSLQLRQLEDSILDKMDDFKDELMSENFRFKAEMFKEFMVLRKEIQKSLEACSINEALVSEIARLREENKRLKKLF